MDIPTLVKVDLNKSPRSQEGPTIHNRWHPDIPPIASVEVEQAFRIECLDWTGGQIGNNDSAEDVKNVDLDVTHHLSGPIAVKGAEPGDILEVEIFDIQPLPGDEWGYTAVFDKANGGGFLCSEYPKACKAVWDFEGIVASSRHIPGVRFAGLIHPGLIGCAPSHSFLAEWNKREATLISSEPGRVPPLALGPLIKGALVGKLEGTPAGEKVKAEGARTIPPREHGGNCDIKNLSRGSRIWLPVYVKGANLSMGDIHFSQGDGEISFCGAIEMSGVLTLKTRIIKNGVSLHGMKNPFFLPGPVEPLYKNYLTFEGISVDENGKQHYLDANVAFKQAVLNCIEYFKKHGYSGEQIYLLLSAAPVNGTIASIVDIPNACCTLGVPTEIFSFDILPKAGGHQKQDRGKCAMAEESVQFKWK